MTGGKTYVARIEDLLIVDAIEKTLVKLSNYRNISYNQAIAVMFMQGFEYLSTKPESELTDNVDKTNLLILRELQKISFEESREQHLFKLLGGMGKEEFAAWCTLNNINSEPIIGGFEEYKARDAINETKNTGLWLNRYLGDYLPHKYNDIITDAQIDGIIPDAILYPEENKSRIKTLRNIASSCGYTDRNHKGIWQKTLR